MSVAGDALVFGITGAFGSGCSAVTRVLSSKLQFEPIKLSDLIKEAWQEENQGPVDQGAGPPRDALQDIGDRFRDEYGPQYWAKIAAEKAEQASASIHRLVLDGIRNPGEVEWLRTRFRRFYLIAVDAHPNQRWSRLRNTPAWKGKTRTDFDAISARDRAAPEDWGQRVQQCVDLADAVITNDDDYDVPARVDETLLEKAEDFFKLCRTPYRRPNDQERFLHVAYAAAAGSACVMRNVGAVIVRPGAEGSVGLEEHPRLTPSVIAVAFNENPDFMQPCYLEYGACFRDSWQITTFQRRGYQYCPHCRADISSIGWPYRCPNKDCRAEFLLESFFPERAMSKCTALHAEVRAILSARGSNLSGCHMYVTTMPCFLCAEQILHAGITRVTYVEPYPDQRAVELLTRHGVSLVRFSGVKSLAFSRLFGPWRAEAEQRSTSTIARSSASNTAQSATRA